MSLGGREIDRDAPAAITRKLQPATRRGPGWLASLCLHATVLCALAWILRNSGDTGISPQSDSGPANLYVVQPEPSATVRIEETPPPMLPEAAQPLVVPPQQPDPTSEPIVPPRAAIASTSTGAGSTRDGPGGGGNGSGLGLGGNGGETSFFGIRDRGLKFVYVLDNSGSMSAFNAITYAKAELMASLDALEPSQEFQILFYNEQPHALGSDNRIAFLPATAANRERARGFISEIQVSGGTDHMPALRAALALQPDVLFFLTDAGVPILRAGDLAEIRQLNRSARIHCVEFGRGPELLVESSLRKLAAQNGGTYRYRDVAQLNAE